MKPQASRNELESAREIEDCEKYIKENLDKKHSNQLNDDKDIQSLMQAILFGLKGVCTYISHAYLLGEKNTEINTFIHQALAAGFDNKERDLKAWIDLVKETGKWNFETLKLLDKANCTLGNPTPNLVKAKSKEL
ncbi:hypothetical protein EIN_042630 [Entamoeba invadens IP1]|uniref:Uncharacterized protein n=1 Tax=Entamoeba invadens IP1 TaxID=370355 RepID=L7FQL5_ENTIV|nr:hypothetical protein EIN_042630 [Entamoeba invadens IP1]ELP94574.1 hypothetical protein EIN_042630 [Entamoeba invadens IP1]|eukprot:XP_004261345.1 hypothetical protein EIN_042630 [Entamoeba invadens IP1]